MPQLLIIIALWCQPLPGKLEIDCRDKLLSCLDVTIHTKGNTIKCLKEIDFTKVK